MLTQTAPVIATPALSADKPARNGAVKAQEPLEIEAQIAYMEQPGKCREMANSLSYVTTGFSIQITFELMLGLEISFFLIYKARPVKSRSIFGTFSFIDFV